MKIRQFLFTCALVMSPILVGQTIPAEESFPPPPREFKVFTNSGTVDRIAKFDVDGTTLVNSNMYESSGMIGINTSTVDRSLVIGANSTNDGIRMRRAVTNNPYIDFHLNTNGAAPFGFIQVADSVAYRALSLQPNGGKVGIGTATPSVALHVFSANTTDAVVGMGTDPVAGPALNIGYGGSSYGRGSGFINARPDAAATYPNPSLRLATADVQRMIITADGRVGIGTLAPESILHINGTTTQYVAVQRGTKMMYVNANASGANVYSQIANRAADAMGLSLTSKDSNPEYLYVATNGFVGIGTTAPGRALDVVGNSMGVGLRAFDPSAINTGFGAGVEFSAKYDVAGSYGTLGMIRGLRHNVASGDRVGRLTLQVSDNTGALVEVARFSPGSMLVTGNAHFNGIVTGTEIRATYQDVAEWVPSRNDIEPATVVVLDEILGNGVKPSDRAYDTTVAGVVSLRPGISLGEGGAGKEQIATTGRVRVKVDATAAPIRVGDLLVTSDKPGYAMKSIPLDIAGVSIHRPGTIVGKALETIENGEGEILVLLSLQ